ncbi:glycosyltransferase family 1 protein [Hansschlegelia zhihuaiae]|uniref:Glycosyltransferase family 1 protein n=2 Tax=Hansschlegelia zhihuaiae TaxID=405005 RepID=A0A4Q0MCB8_9HYPH|nr:glycosyltransferase family 1 protein [Hansschlegelia zhihuaiae]
MRILSAIIVPPHLSASGAARAGEELSAALTAHCDVTVANMMKSVPPLSPWGRPARRAPVATSLPPLAPWSRLPQRFSTLFYRSNIPDLIAMGGYDLVHLHNPMPALELERAARACRARRIPYVISTHGFNEVANGERIHDFGPVRRLVWRRYAVEPVRRAVAGAAAVLTLSPADEPIVRAMGFRGRTIVVSNGVARPPASDPHDDARICASLGVPPVREPGQITCMFLANHTPNKGLPVLFQAFAKLKRPCLLIVGGETRTCVDYEAVKRACGPGRQVVVTGRLHDDALGALFRRSDLFVFPTLADTFPLVVLEAMAHGLPVVASDVGGIPHEIDAGSGVLVPPGQALALARIIDRLAAQPDRLRAMGDCARRRVQSEFSWEKAAERAFAGYETTLAERSPHDDAHALRNRPVAVAQ